MDDPGGWSAHLPKFLDPQRVALGVHRFDALPCDPALGEEAAGSLRKHDHLRQEIHRRSVCRARAPVPTQASRSRSHSMDNGARHEEGVHRVPREQVDP